MSPADDSGLEETRPFRMLSPGTVISHYKIVEKIGEGGMGVVYKATDTKLARTVALKFLPPRLLCEAEARTRFEHEAKAASAITHPNITTIYEIDEVSDQCFISMEYIDGVSLKELAGGKPLSIEEILAIAIQIGEGLRAAHQEGVIHRDIKSANIMRAANGVVKITDFGLAKLRGATKLTKTGTTLGTIQYMSPEQALGEDVDKRSDLFSLGVVLYEMITGQLPFKGEHEQAVVYSILNDTPEPLARFKTGVPEGVQRIVNKALAKDKEERYQDAGDLVADLKHEKKLLERGRERAGRVPTEAGAWRSRKRLLRVLIPAAVAAAAALFLFIFEPFRVEIGPRQEAAARENSLAIMYFENVVDRADPEKLGEIVANLLITDLSESRYMSVVSGQRLYDILKLLGKEGVKVVDREVASEVATRAHAKLMLLGSILQVRPQVIVTSQLVEVEGGRVRASQRVAGEIGEQIFPIVDRLAAEIRKDLLLPAEARNEPDRPVADVTTHSPEAYRYYVEGRDYSFRYLVDEAQMSFEKALEHDSTFAMAYYRLSGLLEDEKRSDEMLAKAAHYMDGVSERERHYIRAGAAGSRGDLAQAMREIEQILKRYPDDKEALGILASYHGAMLGFQKAIDDLVRIVEMDSLYKPAYRQLASYYDMIGDFPRALWAANRCVSLAPAEHAPYVTRGIVFANNGRIDEAIESYKKALEIKPDYGASLANLGQMHLFKREYAKAESLYRMMCAGTSVWDRSEGRMWLGTIPMYQGKFNEAIETLDAGIKADRMDQTEYWLAEKHQLKSEIYFERNERVRAMEECERALESARQVTPGYEFQLSYFLVLHLAESGEIARAEDLAETMRRHFEATDNTKTQMLYYWFAVGCVERAKGNLAAAATNFEKSAGVCQWFPAVYMLGMAYYESGQLGEAVAEFEKALAAYGEDRADDPIEAVKAYYLLGLAYEQSGWNKKAIENYEEFLEIWKDADPGIPEVEDARQRLAGLK